MGPSARGRVIADCTGCSCRLGMRSTSIPSRERVDGLNPCLRWKIGMDFVIRGNHIGFSKKMLRRNKMGSYNSDVSNSEIPILNMRIQRNSRLHWRQSIVTPAWGLLFIRCITHIVTMHQTLQNNYLIGHAPLPGPSSLLIRKSDFFHPFDIAHTNMAGDYRPQGGSMLWGNWGTVHFIGDQCVPMLDRIQQKILFRNDTMCKCTSVRMRCTFYRVWWETQSYKRQL